MKKEIKKILLFIIVLGLAWVLIVLVYVLLLASIFKGSIWEGLILGGSGYFSIVYTNKFVNKILSHKKK